jgi:hypothetical protein
MAINILTKIEQTLRGICFIIYLAAASTFLVIETLFHPLYPKLDQLSGNYFSTNFKRGPLNHYFVHYWAVGLFQLFGINVIHEFRVRVY